MTATLSKSDVLSGLRCHKALWWREHEPDAPELKPSGILLDRFDQGRHVGQLAREHVPGGVLIGTPFNSMADRIALTRQELEAGADLLYEAAFAADGVHVLLDPPRQVRPPIGRGRRPLVATALFVAPSAKLDCLSEKPACLVLDRPTPVS